MMTTKKKEKTIKSSRTKRILTLWFLLTAYLLVQACRYIAIGLMIGGAVLALILVLAAPFFGVLDYYQMWVFAILSIAVGVIITLVYKFELAEALR